MTHDTIIIGLGGMGSAVADHLARAGQRVLGFDRYDPPHTLGSTHGKSRIIRLAYMEDPAYVPLLRRAYDLWRELERDSGQALLTITGGLMVGREDSEAVAGSLASARQHDLPHELLDAGAIRRRFPLFEVPDDYAALYEDIAGVLIPERCIETYLRRAAAAGADLRTGTTVSAWEPDGDGVVVHASGESFRARHLVITAGPWAGDLLPEHAPSLQPTRQIMHWFQPPDGIDRFMPGRFPVYVWEPPTGDVIYGFPALDGPDGGVKVAIHHGGEETTADTADRDVHDADVARIRAALAERIPALNGNWLEGAVCLYTNTPDHDFLLGRHPHHDQVVLAAGLSGHGFKFASVVGEVLGELVLEGGTEHPIVPFDTGRLG